MSPKNFLYAAFSSSGSAFHKLSRMVSVRIKVFRLSGFVVRIPPLRLTPAAPPNKMAGTPDLFAASNSSLAGVNRRRDRGDIELRR